MEGIGVKYYNNNLVVRVNISSTKLISQDISGITKYLDDAILKTIYNTPQFIPLPHSQQVKLRTFANKTNISFLTEIEGTIKAQVPKSLGATVNTHTEQINNLNKELDRVKKLEESTVSTVTTESDFTTVEATSGGYFEDVKLEGKTLVNLWDINKMNKLPSISVTDNYVTVNATGGWIDCHPKYTAGAVPMLKPNTEYTVIAHVKNNTLNSYMNLNMEKDDKSPFTKNVMLEQGFTGYYIGKLNTKTDLSKSDTSLRCQVGSSCTTGSVTFNCILLEGDHTQNPPSGYFEGLKSVGQSATTSEDGVDEIVVSSSNKNFIDIVHQNEIIPQTGVLNERTSESWQTTSLIKLKKNNYVFSTVDGDGDGYTYVYTYDLNGVYKGIDYRIDLNTSKKSITLNEDCLIRISSRKINTTKLQLEIGSTLTNYETKKQDKKRLLYYNEETQTWEKPILREWDSIEKHANGKYYYHQRSGTKVLNGSEGWTGNYSFENTGRWVCTIPNIKENSPLVCDKFINKVNHGDGVESIFVPNPNKLYLTLSNDKGDPNVWLQTNPVTVVYQLAEEKVYECTNIDLITYNGETNFIVESGVLSPKTTLKVHSNISNVVSLLQKKVSLLESNMTKYMITQNRLMLASRYNADTVSFKVDVASFSDAFEYDNDLYELILNNVLVGKDNYNREYIENLIRFYWMDFVISDEMYSTLFEIIEEQHNPKIEEETPLI